MVSFCHFGLAVRPSPDGRGEGCDPKQDAVDYDQDTTRRFKPPQVVSLVGESTAFLL